MHDNGRQGSPAASIVIPACNEEAVIGRCLDALLSTAALGEFDITVVANGCTDATARVAAARSGVRVLELPVPGKTTALNAGDRVAATYPRVYLDADREVTAADLRALCAALEDPGTVTHRQPLAVTARREVDVSRSPHLTRAYYAIHTKLPVFRNALFGRGIIALSAEGRARFHQFPDVVADDLFLDSLFTAAEKREVSAVQAPVAAPRRTRDLVRRLARVRRGNATLRAAAPASSHSGNARRRARRSWLTDVVLGNPALAPAAVCYVLLTGVAATLARRQAVGWGQDESVRQDGRGRDTETQFTFAASARRGDRRRVLILVQNLPVPLDRRVWQEALALTQAQYEVHVVCPRTREYPRRREIIDGIHIYRYSPVVEARRAPSYFLEYGIAVLAQLSLAIRLRVRRRIDVVHICNPPDLLFLAALPLVAVGARLIYDHHDATPELMIAKGQREGSVLVRLTTFLERLTYRCARVSIETNESFVNIAERRGQMSPEDVFVVRSAPDLERFHACQPDETWRRGRKHLVGYVGIMGSQDGLDYLIDAAALIIRQWRRDDIQFILVGSGPELQRLQARVKTLDIADFVEFTGLVSSGSQLGSIISSADVCVCPDEANRMNDISTMNKILEYMALGRPIVQFDLHEGRISAGPASLYAERNDVASLASDIVRLVDDSVLAERMGQAGRERFTATLSWESQIPQLLAAYARALRD